MTGNLGGFHGTFMTNVLVLPTVILSICIFIYISQVRTIKQVIRAGGSDESALETAKVQLRKNVFFGAFLIYPTITTTLFRVPQCRRLGDHLYHEDDYSVRCDAASFYSVELLTVILVIVVPVGVPAGFLFLMYRQKQVLGMVNETALGGAKLAAVSTPDDDDRYGFLVRDFRPEFWFYEIVTYLRKLLLGGFTVLMGRGTMAQTYFVTSVQAAFLIYHMHRCVQSHLPVAGHTLSFANMATLQQRLTCPF
eukprot:COSAG02_NODE_367_length_23739_cov_16.775127_11_plen_251_part_00